jgi:nitroimidazol reductase NimA-like FMN-containing flavoprotein (pyridoxamine 5'-phosphate oxidase superfamily)
MDFPYLARLDVAECRRLLPTAAVARLAVPTPTFPTVEPVSFALVEGEVVVAVRSGSAGEAVSAGTQVSLEADFVDHAARTGWSVSVSGRVEDLDADVAAIVAPLLRPWPVVAGDRLLLVRSERVGGRRVVAGPDDLAAPAGVRAATGITGFEVPAGSVPAPNSRRELTSAEALRFLGTGDERVGRLVITLADGPAVFPVNYALDGDAVVFRTRVGTKLSGITRSMATFEVDHIDAAGQGWAVTLEGLAQEVLDSDPPALRARIAALALDSWPGGDRNHVVRITPYAVHGAAWTAAGTTADASAHEAQVRPV